MKTRIGVLGDVHFSSSPNSELPSRRSELADILLLRAVRRFNRLIRPDAVVILGDMLDAGSQPGHEEGYRRLRKTLDLLDCPWLAIPGNHDAPEHEFYKFLPRPEGSLDVKGSLRIVPFIDPEEPGYNARRDVEGLRRMDHVRDDGWRGPILAVQHVPVFPEGSSPCPYSYTNAAEIIEAMRRNGISTAVAGHYHKGFELVRDSSLAFAAVPALCERPFEYMILEISGESVALERQSLAMPEGLSLWDCHVHSQMAYCSENMDVRTGLSLGRDFGLAGLSFTEHSGHLYASKDDYWSRRCLDPSFKLSASDRRVEAYLELLEMAGCEGCQRGLELDCRYDGSLLADPGDLAKFPFKTGAVHSLKSLKGSLSDLSAAKEEFLRMNAALLSSGIDVLAHPFRVFARAGVQPPEDLYAPLIKMLKDAGAAAELNFHTNDPDAKFISLCAESGVKVALGSDAHNLYEIGEFHPHLSLLAEAGVRTDEFADMLFAPSRRSGR